MIEVVVNGAAIIGAVNVLNIAFPNMTSLQRVVAALVIGGVFPYLPDLGPVVKGVELALATSGVYKLTQKVGGN